MKDTAILLLRNLQSLDAKKDKEIVIGYSLSLCFYSSFNQLDEIKFIIILDSVLLMNFGYL